MSLGWIDHLHVLYKLIALEMLAAGSLSLKRFKTLNNNLKEIRNAMKSKRTQLMGAAIIAFTAILAARSASASIITSASDSALNGANLIDFSSASIGNYSSLYLSPVTFSGVSGIIRVQNVYSGQYNTTGLYLDNNQGSTPTFRFTFDSPLTAFGFNYGALDVNWVLRAFDSNNNLIESTSVAANFASNAGQFVGISSTSANIAYATFSDGGDWILMDNFYTSANAAVPEPSTYLAGALLLLPFGAHTIRRLRTPKQVS